jgi:hypothetical protein
MNNASNHHRNVPPAPLEPNKHNFIIKTSSIIIIMNENV